jgi:hypothetical protein
MILIASLDAGHEAVIDLLLFADRLHILARYSKSTEYLESERFRFLSFLRLTHSA